MTLIEALSRYLLHLQSRDLSTSHTGTVDYRVKRFINTSAHTSIASVTQTDIRSFITSLKSDGSADATLAGFTSTLKTFFNWCVKQGIITESPAAGLKKYDYDPVHFRAAPTSSVEALAAAVILFANHRNRPRDLRDALFISMVIDSGSRLGELHSLRKKDLQSALQSGVPTQSERISYQIIGKGKTGGLPVLFFEETAQLASRWLDERPWQDAPFVFISLDTGKRLRKASLGRSFERICKFVDVPTIRAHSIRKRNVTDVIRQSGDLTIGQKYAGHKSPETTMRHYNDLQNEDVINAAATLANQRRPANKFHQGMEKLFKQS